MLVGDIAWLPSKRRFATVINRFRWEDEPPERTDSVSRPKSRRHRRARAGLRFENVLKVQFRNVPVKTEGHVLSLLAVEFEEAAESAEAANGHILLVCSGFAEIRLEVECIEAYLEDIGTPWRVRHKPDHAPGEGPGPGPDAKFIGPGDGRGGD